MRIVAIALIMFLGCSGNNENDNIISLVGMLNSPDYSIRTSAEAKLKHIGPPALPELMEIIINTENDAHLRINAISFLWKVGPEAKKAVPYLLRTIKEDNFKLRVASVRALGDIDPANKDVIAALMKALGDKNDDVSIEALFAISNAGLDAVPKLAKLLNSSDGNLSIKAALLLQENRKFKEQIYPILIHALSHDNIDLRMMTAEALSKYGPMIIPELVKAMKTENYNVSSAVLGTLMYMYAHGTLPDQLDSAIPIFMALLEDKNIEILKSTSDFIAKLGADAKETIPALIKNLNHSNREVRSEAVYALIHIGPVGIPDLAKALTDDHSNTRDGSLAVLCEFDPLPDSLITPLANLLDEENPVMRRIAILTLGNIQPKNSQIIEILKKAINDKDKNVGLSAKKTLSKILDEDNTLKRQNH